MERTPRQSWGWTASARGLLALVVAALAAALLATGRDGPPRHPLPPLAVDPNTAPEAVLGALPRIGPARARAIADARREAPFADLDDLERRVKGVGPATLAALRPHLRIGTPPTPPAP